MRVPHTAGLVFVLTAACATAGAEPALPALPDPSPTTTTAPCRNSDEPRCGEFRYDPPVANQEMRVEVAFTPDAPRVGQEVLFTVTVTDDGPAEPGRCVNYQQFAANDDYRTCTRGCPEPEPRYGPWDPPPPENSHFTEEFRHSYPRRGTHTATFAYNAGDNCHPSPYRSQGTARVEVPVTAR